MKKWLGRYLPTASKLNNYREISAIKKFIASYPQLWVHTPHAIAGGAAAGLLVAFLPLPFQMLIAAFLSILLRVNLPLAIVMTWINNPFTFIPINFGMYYFGTWLMAERYVAPAALPGLDIIEIWRWLISLGKPYVVGLIVVDLGVSFGAYSLIRFVFFCVSLRKPRHRA